MSEKELNKNTFGKILKIQAFAERFAERLDAQSKELRVQGNHEAANIERARAEAFWVMRNYIEDSYVQDWSDEQ